MEELDEYDQMSTEIIDRLAWANKKLVDGNLSPEEIDELKKDIPKKLEYLNNKAKQLALRKQRLEKMMEINRHILQDNIDELTQQTTEG